MNARSLPYEQINYQEDKLNTSYSPKKCIYFGAIPRPQAVYLYVYLFLVQFCNKDYIIKCILLM